MASTFCGLSIQQQLWLSDIFCVGLLVFAVGLAVVVMVAAAREYFYPPHVPLEGVIIRKSYRPAWTQHSFIMAGKVMVPTQIHHPESWWLVVQETGTKGDAGQFCFEVTKAAYQRLAVGDDWERT